MGIEDRIPWRDFPALAKAHFELTFGERLHAEASWTLDDGQTHRFDLASSDGKIVIECKSYTYTKTGNEPAAKLSHAKNDALTLRAANALTKIIVFDDDEHPKKGSLAVLFARRNRAWLADVQVWRHWNGSFERVDDRN